MLKKYQQLISIIILIVFCCFIYFNGERKSKDYTNKILKGKPLITNGVVKSIDYANKHGYNINFEFSYNYVLITGIKGGKVVYDIKNFIIGKTFPVIVSSEDQTYNDMLIVPEDFKKYNIPFPDSLKWIDKILSNSH